MSPLHQKRSGGILNSSQRMSVRPLNLYGASLLTPMHLYVPSLNFCFLVAKYLDNITPELFWKQNFQAVSNLCSTHNDFKIGIFVGYFWISGDGGGAGWGGGGGGSDQSRGILYWWAQLLTFVNYKVPLHLDAVDQYLPQMGAKWLQMRLSIMETYMPAGSKV